MPIVRRKLDANTVYPANLRYDLDTDTVQSLVNGDWVDNPDADPRRQTTFPARMTSDTGCDAAQSVSDAIRNQVTSTITAVGNASTAFTIAGIILSLFSFGVFAVFIDLALFIGNQMIDAGAAALADAFTAPVWHTFTCILRCHFQNNGRIEPGSIPEMQTDINAQIGGIAGTLLDAMLQLAGEGGINNLAAIGTSTGDCADCNCVTPCSTAVDNGFEFGGDLVYTVDTGSGITTVTGSSINVAPAVEVVRWGFFADSIPEGCHFGEFTIEGVEFDSYWYREVGEADNTQHGPVSYDSLITNAGPLCLNLLQVNAHAPFTFTLTFYGC